MDFSHADEAVAQLEKANANLEPELLSLAAARAQLKTYVRAQRLAAFGVAALARRIDDTTETPGQLAARPAKPRTPSPRARS